MSIDAPSLAAEVRSKKPFEYVAGVLAPVLEAFNASQSAVEATYARQGVASALPVGVAPMVGLAASVTVGDVTLKALDLTPYLRRANWDEQALVPGFVDAFRWNGRVMGVPYAYSPTGVRIDVADWRRLDVALPADGWTSADFTTACTLLHAARGRKESVLGGAPGFAFPRASVWTGWVWGYGGQLVSGDGRVVLTDRAAVEGIAALTAAARAARPNMCAYRGELAFTPAGRRAFPPVGVLAGTGLWPFPVMPVAPVVPAVVSGLGVNPAYPHPQLAANFLAWLTSAAGQAQMVAAGYPSVLTKAPAGSAAWMSAYPPGFDHGGLRVPPTRVRAIPWQVWLLSDLLGITVWRALGLTAASELQSLLAKSERQANAALALRGTAQTQYLAPFRKWYTLRFPPMTAADGACFLAALPGEDPSPYASAVPPPPLPAPVGSVSGGPSAG